MLKEKNKVPKNYIAILFFVVLPMILISIYFFQNVEIKKNPSYEIGTINLKLITKTGISYFYTFQISTTQILEGELFINHFSRDEDLVVGDKFIVVYSKEKPSINRLLKNYNIDKETNLDSLYNTIIIKNEI